MATTNNKVSTAQAKINATGIRQLWRTGRDSLAHIRKLTRTNPDALGYGRRGETLRAEAQRHGMSYDSITKSIRLATEYSRADIDMICQLVIKHSSTFAAANALTMLRIEDRATRDKIMKQAVRGSWSYARLELAVQGLYRVRRRAGGRKPSVPDDPVARLVVLEATLHKMIRFCTAALPQLPASLKPRLQRAVKAARTVQHAVAAKLQQQNKRPSR